MLISRILAPVDHRRKIALLALLAFLALC